MTKKNDRRIRDRDVREVIRIMGEVGSMAVAVEKVVALKTLADYQSAERQRLYEKSYKEMHKQTTTSPTEPSPSLFPDVRFQLPEYLHVEEETKGEDGKTRRKENFLEKGRAQLAQVAPGLHWRTIETQKIARGAGADEKHWTSNDLPKLAGAGVPGDATVNEARWWGVECYLCGKPYDPTRPWDPIEREHPDPVSNGGEGPTRPAHKECNQAKAARLGYEQLPFDEDEDEDE